MQEESSSLLLTTMEIVIILLLVHMWGMVVGILTHPVAETLFLMN